MKKFKIITLLALAFSCLAFVLVPALPFVGNKLDIFGCAYGALLAQYKIHALLGSGMLMIGSVFSCSDDSNPRVCDDCVEEELNKVVHVAFVKRGTTITTTSAAAFSASILAAELACNATIIRNVSGAYDGGKAQKGKGAGKQTSRTLGKKHTLTFTDFNYTRNVNFWNSFESSAANYDLYFFTDTYGWVATSTFISLEAQGVITDNNETFIEANVVVEWSYKNNPVPYKALVDLLAECQELFDSLIKTFSNRSGSYAVVTGSAGSQVATISSGNAFGVELDTAVTLGSAAITTLSDALPAGLAVSVSGTKIIISGTPTVAGTSLVTIAGCSRCNICSEVSLTITVV